MAGNLDQEDKKEKHRLRNTVELLLLLLCEQVEPGHQADCRKESPERKHPNLRTLFHCAYDQKWHEGHGGHWDAEPGPDHRERVLEDTERQTVDQSGQGLVN